MHIYTLPPIDYFEAFLPAEDYVARVRESDGDSQAAAAQAYVDRCVAVLEGETYYVQSDHASGPWISALPDDQFADPRIMVAVKGQNNGSVYLAAPYALPWLSEYLQAEVDGPGRPEWRNEW